MYLFITDIFYVHSFAIKLLKSFYNAYLFKIGLFKKIFSTAVKINKKKRYVLTKIVY